MSTRRRWIRRPIAAVVALSLCLLARPTCSRAGLIFSFTEGAELAALTGTNAGLRTQVLNGFTSAAGIWQNLFSDNVTVRITINYAPLGAGILGSNSSETIGASLPDVRTALTDDRHSADDFTAVANLPTGSSVSMRTNDRSGAVIFDNDGSGNNSVLDISRANARALGLVAANDPGNDATITFSSNFAFDFDRSNGIQSNQYDFIGIATHEIGHAMGFVSGVDIVDYLSGSGPGVGIDLNGATDGLGTIDPYRVFSVLDLYRTSDLAPAGGRDWAYGGTPRFSIDGGATYIDIFSNGQFNGSSGRQASHWQDFLQSVGIMDPTFANGELGSVSALDIQAFDVIGWDLQAVPEPGSFLLAAAATSGWVAARIRRRSSKRDRT